MILNAGNFPHLVDVYGEQAKARLRLLQDVVRDDPTSGRSFQIRIVPDSEFGFIHGKGGVLRSSDGRDTSFIGTANDSHNAWAANYELVWEDDDPSGIQWVQEEPKLCDIRQPSESRRVEPSASCKGPSKAFWTPLPGVLHRDARAVNRISRVRRLLRLSLGIPLQALELFAHLESFQRH
jgi:hypothetical protein